MKRAALHDNITLSYEGKLADGEVFASSQDTGPLTFKLGKGDVLPEIEKAVLGMMEGETKIFEIPPKEAFGYRMEDLIHTVDRLKLSGNETPKVGMIVTMTMEKDGKEHPVPAEIIAAENDRITLDFNHPLAGKTLTYELTISSLTKGSPPLCAQNQCNCGEETKTPCGNGECSC